MSAERSVNDRIARIVGWKCPRCYGARKLPMVSGDSPVKEFGTGKQATVTCRCEYPPYSTSADAALEAYAVMRERGWKFMAFDEGRFRVRLYCKESRVGWDGIGPTFASALCAAILAASEKERG